MLCAAVLGSSVYLLRESIIGLYTGNPVIVAAALPLLAWVVLFHVADAAQTIAAFVLRVIAPQTYPAAYALWIVLAACCWLAGFGILGWRLIPFLLQARVDGKEH